MLKSKTTAPRKRRGPELKDLEWGSAAAATVGRTTLEVDEATNGSAWHLIFEIPSLYLTMQIEGPLVLTQLHQFLRGDQADTSKGALPLGRSGALSIEFLRDNEIRRRYYILINGGALTNLRVTLNPEATEEWIAALDDVLQQLED